MMALLDEFLTLTASPSQAQIDWLRKQGIQAMTPIRDGDGDGFPLGVARVEQVGKRFEFRPEDGVGAYAFLARDEDGEAADIVCWAPRAGWAASWRGHVAVLGQHEVLAPRMGEPLPVHRDPLGWLRAGRSGIVLLPGQRTQVRLLLEAHILLAEDIEHGLELRRILAAPEPRIVVPTSITREAAA